MTTLQALIIFLPAGVANAAPVLANKIPLLNHWRTPMDFGKSFRGIRIFGDNKTWRGLVFGIIIGIFCALIISRLLPNIFGSEFMAIITGGLLGLGALYGDAVESFFKRQRGTKPGQSWFPFDQLDFIIGALIATLPLRIFSLADGLAILIVYFGLHLLTAYLGFRLGLKDQPI